LTFQACWTDADCSEPYTCVLGDELHVSTADSSGLCGRGKE
jgi:hypothetical protein